MVAATQIERTQRNVFASVCATWFVLGGCVLLVRVAKQERHKSRRLSVVSYFGQLRGLCRSLALILAGTVCGLSAKQVAQELQKRRLARMRAAMPYACVSVAGVLGNGLYMAALGVSRQFSVVQDVCQFVGCFILLFLWASPSSLTSRTVDVWFSFVMACIVLWVSPLASGGFFSGSSIILPLGGTLSMCLLNMHHFNIIWLWLVSLSMCSTIYLGAASPLEDCLTGRGERAGRVLMATVVLTFFVACLYHSFYLAVSCDMEANVSRNELKAARSVLRGVCDVVVELDSDFRLQDGCPELADLLLLNPRRPLLGEDLRQFLASQQDRKKFSEQMGKVWLLGEEEVGLSAAFHVSMRDSSSIPLDVEVFCVRFVNREGLAAYFVGIREFTDTAPMVRDSASERTRPGGRLRGPPSACTAHFMPPAAPADSTAPASSQASSDVSSESCSLDVSWEDPGAEVEPVAWVDVLTPNYSVRLKTPAFTEHVDARGELLTAMRQSQQSEFASWAQEAYFALLEEGAASAHQQYHRRLHFRSFAQQDCALGSRPSRRLLSALLRLDLTRPPDGQDLGRGVVRIVLQDILLGRRLPRRPRRLSRRGTPLAITQAASGQLLAQGQISRGAAPAAALAGGAAPPEAAGGPAQREGTVSRPPSCGPAAQPSQAVGLGRTTHNL